jgi:hypothetical protein
MIEFSFCDFQQMLHHYSIKDTIWESADAVSLLGPSSDGVAHATRLTSVMRRLSSTTVYHEDGQ